MTRGSRGASLITESEIVHFPAFPIEPVDTTAAGDAFVGSFAVALAEGRSISEAVRYGNAAGALSSTKSGAQPSMPGRDDLNKMLQTM
jgi:ribokinase